jgi:cytochrome c oxidase subunit II
VPLTTTRTPPSEATEGSTKSRRRLGFVALLLSPLLLTGCSMSTFGANPSATTTGNQSFHLWQGFTIGAIAVGGFTLALIVFAALRYRVRHSDVSAPPRQSQYHLPLEITYTILPLLIVLVLFAFTVVVEDQVTALPPPQTTIKVQAFQWGWRFEYPGFAVVGQTTQQPILEMPEHENVRIVLTSLDVVHGFYIHDFNFSRYALPGIVNQFTFDADKTGHFFGQCTQLCGLYHSLMWFRVWVVTPAQFATYEAKQSKVAANLAAKAAGAAAAEQSGAGIAVKPELGGGIN